MCRVLSSHFQYQSRRIFQEMNYLRKKLSMSKLIMHYQSKTYLAFLFLIDFCDFGFDFELILILLLLFLLPFLDFKYVFRFLDN